MTIGIIGLGLIGGSMAIDLRRNKFADKFLGCDNIDLNAMTAQRIGLVDEVMPYDELIKKSDLILLSVPAGEVQPSFAFWPGPFYGWLSQQRKCRCPRGRTPAGREN